MGTAGRLVEVTGIEPVTSCMPCKRSPKTELQPRVPRRTRTFDLLRVMQAPWPLGDGYVAGLSRWSSLGLLRVSARWRLSRFSLYFPFFRLLRYCFRQQTLHM